MFEWVLFWQCKFTHTPTTIIFFDCHSQMIRLFSIYFITYYSCSAKMMSASQRSPHPLQQHEYVGAHSALHIPNVMPVKERYLCCAGHHHRANLQHGRVKRLVHARASQISGMLVDVYDSYRARTVKWRYIYSSSSVIFWHCRYQ